MWIEFMAAKNSFGGDIWCVLRDFNSVLTPNERVGAPILLLWIVIFNGRVWYFYQPDGSY